MIDCQEVQAYQSETAQPQIMQKHGNKKVINFVVAIEVFREWLERGFITETESRHIESLTADRHGLPENSMYR